MIGDQDPIDGTLPMDEENKYSSTYSNYVHDVIKITEDYDEPLFEDDFNLTQFNAVEYSDGTVDNAWITLVDKGKRKLLTNYIHDGIKMTEYENEPFVVGDYNHNQVEFLDMSHERWYTASPYQITARNNIRIFGYSPVLGSESSQSFCDSTF